MVLLHPCGQMTKERKWRERFCWVRKKEKGKDRGDRGKKEKEERKRIKERGWEEKEKNRGEGESLCV